MSLQFIFDLLLIRDHLTLKTTLRVGHFGEVPLNSPPSQVCCVPSEDVSSPPVERCVSRLLDAVFHPTTLEVQMMPKWRFPWWRHQMETFSALLTICVRNHRSPLNSPHKGRWRGALMFSLICAGINGWVNNREAGDLRRHRAHYDVIVIIIRVRVRYRPPGWLASWYSLLAFFLLCYVRCWG